MTINESPTLEDALDGLIEAAIYADDVDEIDHRIAYEIGVCYRQLAQAAPDDHWDDAPPESEHPID